MKVTLKLYASLAVGKPILALSETGMAESQLFFADGPPCTAPFDDHSVLMSDFTRYPDEDA